LQQLFSLTRDGLSFQASYYENMKSKELDKIKKINVFIILHVAQIIAAIL